MAFAALPYLASVSYRDVYDGFTLIYQHEIYVCIVPIYESKQAIKVSEGGEGRCTQ